jgi:hypothetical protein
MEVAAARAGAPRDRPVRWDPREAAAPSSHLGPCRVEQAVGPARVPVLESPAAGPVRALNPQTPELEPTPQALAACVDDSTRIVADIDPGLH